MNDPNLRRRVYLEERQQVLLARWRAVDASAADEFSSNQTELEEIHRTAAEGMGKGAYGGFKRAIDALDTLLSTSEPCDRMKAARILVEGGFDASSSRALYNVLDSIRYHSKPGGRLIVDDQDRIRRANPDD